MRIHELFAKGAGEVRRRRRLTQEQASNVYRGRGLLAWRTSTVGSLEAGLRRPRLDEMLLIANALQVPLADLFPGGDDERVQLGDGAVVSPLWIREAITGELYREDRPDDDTPFAELPVDSIIEEVLNHARAARERAHEAQIAEWAKQRGTRLMAEDLFASRKRPSDAERHAAQRLAAEISDVKLTARALWNRDLDEERDYRIGNVNELPPRSRQARRGLVTRQMLAELRAAFLEIGIIQNPDGDNGLGELS